MVRRKTLQTFLLFYGSSRFINNRLPDVNLIKAILFWRPRDLFQAYACFLALRCDGWGNGLHIILLIPNFPFWYQFWGLLRWFKGVSTAVCSFFCVPIYLDFVVCNLSISTQLIKYIFLWNSQPWRGQLWRSQKPPVCMAVALEERLAAIPTWLPIGVEAQLVPEGALGSKEPKTEKEPYRHYAHHIQNIIFFLIIFHHSLRTFHITLTPISHNSINEVQFFRRFVRTPKTIFLFPDFLRYF